MFFLRRPNESTVRRFLESQRGQPFSYPETGATRDRPPAGYTVDHNRIQLGRGGACFAQAVAAVRNWKMFDLGWVAIHDARTPIAEGETVAVIASHLGFWSLNACRIVYVIDEDEPVRRFGFAYGTLPDHAECGEERFTVEWHAADDSVWYDILAFSRPQKFLARAGYPVTRSFQKRFARHSKAAMARPIPGAHNIWELALHIAAWEEAARRRISGEPAYSPSDEENFPSVQSGDEAAWRDTLDRLRQTNTALRDRMRELDESRLDEIIEGQPYSAYFMLHGVIQHDLYHAGQIALLKRAIRGGK